MKIHAGLRGLKCLLLLLVLPACSRGGLMNPLPLGTASQNHVLVEISLERDSDGTTWLTATFTPDDPGLHLYSKDLPRQGSNGLGRPTLLELPDSSWLAAMGEMTESVQADGISGIEQVPVYPAGPVTLRLPVRLPPGKGWFDQEVFVTYMACREGACMPPVENKPIAIRIPGEEEYHP